MSKKRDFYKGKYFIVFYSQDDEELLYMFDNIREILKFQKREINRTNLNLINVEIYRGLKRESREVRFLTGEIMKIYIFDIENEENEE